jgi:hypothetical protein
VARETRLCVAPAGFDVRAERRTRDAKRRDQRDDDNSINGRS